MGRRSWGLLAAIAVLAAGCSSGDKDSSPPVTSSTSTAPAASSTTVAPGPGAKVICRFSDVAAGGEVTWVSDGNLMASRPDGTTSCLVGGVGAGARPVQWSGDGGKVLIDGAVRTATGVQREFTSGRYLRLSRPTGKSVLEIGGARLLKWEAGAATPKDVTFVDQPVEALYHPAGRSIVASGTENRTPVIRIADNLGREARTLALGEEARSLTSLAFTARNALLFVGDHGDESHLHRLELETATLTTVATTKAPGRIADVTTSPFPGGGVAWTEGTACRLVVTQDAKFVDVSGTPVASARPVGWLPDRSLVVRTGGCADTSGDVYVVGAGAPPRLLAKGVGAAAVRAVLPEPEAAPPAIPDQAPA